LMKGTLLYTVHIHEVTHVTSVILQRVQELQSS